MARGIDYGGMMHRAMQRLIADVLQAVATEGLPGDHHFFITFDTRDSQVEMADWLRERYPEEMTIVIQHWFENLEVTDEGFRITLNFGNSPEPLYVPFDALRTPDFFARMTRDEWGHGLDWPDGLGLGAARLYELTGQPWYQWMNLPSPQPDPT